MLEFKVSEILNYIKDITASDYILANLKVEGEISNLKLHSNGIAYFSLKDEFSSIDCIFYNYKDNINIKNSTNGDYVGAIGRIQVQEKDGTLKLFVDDVVKVGIGKLFENFLKTKEKLESEGYFLDIHKKPLPKYPVKIGVITSQDGAAIKDIISVLRKRNNYINLYLFPSYVQGPYSVESLIKGLDYFDNFDVDAVIIGRGGGAYEDLDSFNSLELALKIFNFNKPIISAVGHEVDFVISDYISDRRAATPTAAGEMLFFSIDDYLKEIKSYLYKAKNNIDAKIIKEDSRLSNSKENLSKISIEKLVEVKKDKLNDTIEKLISRLNFKLSINRERLSTISEKINKELLYNTITREKIKIDILKKKYEEINQNKIRDFEKVLQVNKSRLEKLDIIDMLNKGYSVVLDKDNKPIKDLEQVEISDVLSILLSNGELEVKVLRKKGMK